MELNDWAPPERLAAWVGEVTESLLACVGDFADDDERWMGPYLDIVNPPIWEIAHVAWFAEWFVLRQMHGHEPLMADVDARYDSAAVPHLTRWHLDYPTAADTKAYVRAVGEALAEVTLNDRGLDSTAPLVAYAITHYDAHVEALTYTRQTLRWGEAVDDPSGRSAGGGSDGDPAWAASADLPVGGGEFILGASRDQPFVVDNERWGHRVEVEPFAMAAAPVTVAEFADFVDDGGYKRTSLWSTPGWAWRTGAHADEPAYWRRGDAGWERRQLDAWRPIESTADHPMVHVSWWEAEAFCAWAQRRLPTEAEWEFAATTGPDGERQPWFPWGRRDPHADEAALDRRAGATVAVSAHAAGDGPWGHRQLIGNVWEWTESTFEPYPHFEQDSYRDNSWPWFGSRKVLRGGSWATTNRYVRSTFRNYFTPDRRDVIAGFRTCPIC